ncbi:transposase family protein [Streptomyces erythrochromogenes]|uniref:transposase family protein n=1 Tax=Streptomyces erythrochromogenes TaxID=285574 RepID=UPI003686EC9A
MLELVFPHLVTVVVESGVLRIAASTKDGTEAVCPGCGTLSMRVHSRYGRRIADAPVGTHPVLIELSVRRLFCDNSGCARVTFAEQVEGLTSRYGRRTPVLQQIIGALGVVLAARAVVRLELVLGIALSLMTVLRVVMALPAPAWAVPRVLGVGEFATRKGRQYGTILIDDKWHVWHNLGEAVERPVSHHRVLLHSLVEPEPSPEPEPVPVSVGREPSEPYPAGKFLDRLRGTHAAVRAQVEQGLSLREAARHLGLGRNTVRKYARAASPEAMLHSQRQDRTSKLDRYRPYLEQRIAEGCTNLSTLHRELQEHGAPVPTTPCATTSIRCVPDGGTPPADRRWPGRPRPAKPPAGS